MFTHIELHPFQPDRVPLAVPDEFWLAVAGVMIALWLPTAAPNPAAPSSCAVHGPATPSCRAAVSTNCTSFGRGGRICFSRK